MKIRLILVPYHLGHARTGMGRGPERLLQAGADVALAALGHEVDVAIVEQRTPPAHEVGATFELNRMLAESVRDALLHGAFPLVLSGNCNSCLGTLAGVRGARVGDRSAAAPGGGVEDRVAEIGIVWFDAHGDVNTPETTPSGFLDGMALAAATGRCWTSLASPLPGFAPVPEERVLLAGARDLDPGETDFLERSAMLVAPAARLRREGLQAALGSALDALRKRTRSLYLHLDLDVLDPSQATVNPWGAPGGLTVAEMEDAIRMVRHRFAVPAAALASYDPAGDVDGRASAAALRLLGALTEGAG